MKQIVFDTGALIALERRDPRVLALVSEIVRSRVAAFVPAGLVAQAWRGGQRQHALARLLRSGAVRIEPLDAEAGFVVGVLVGAAGTSDVIDGHVAMVAKQVGGAVLTSDPDDIRRLDPSLEIITV